MILIKLYSFAVILAFKKTPSRLALSLAKKARLDPRLIWNCTRLYQISYREKLAAQKVISWYKNNKIGYGIAFGCAMESYFRIVKIIYILIHNELVNDEQRNKLDKILIEEVDYVSSNLEIDSNNNHLFLNVASILLSIYNSKIRKRYSEEYWVGYFNRLVSIHFSEQGVHFEGSSSYQLLCAEAISLLLTNEYFKCTSDSALRKYKSILLSSLALFLGENHNNIAVFGDNDNCTSLFAMDYLNARSYQYHNIRNAINNIDSLLPHFISQDFDRYDTNEFSKIKLNKKTFLFVLCPQKKENAKNGHFNNDSPSFVLAYDGKQVFGNSSTFSYTFFRNYFRSSCAKSSIYPCGLNFYDIDFKSKFKTRNTKYVSKERIADSEYWLIQSYKSLCRIRSIVKASHDSQSISIKSDILPGSSHKEFVSHFVLHPSAKIEHTNPGSVSILFPFGCRLELSTNGEINIKKIFFAKSYMHLGITKRISIQSLENSEILIKLFPHQASLELFDSNHNA